MKQTLANFYKKYKLHLLCWFIFVMYESVITSIVFYNWVNPIIYLSHYFVFITFFYIHADYALPWALKYKKGVYFLLPLIIILEGIGHMGFQYADSYLLRYLEITKIDVKIDLNSILMNVYRSITFLMFSTGYFFLRTFLKERKKREELEKERLQSIISKQQMEQELAQAQHAFLKAQINPHFLFNTLDFIFHEVNNYSEVAGEAIIRLADMMRFAINTDQIEGDIDLGNEIEQVENLLYLHAITKSGEKNILFDYSMAVSRLQFIPLVLLTLVENILKHGDVSRPDDKATISAEVIDDQLVIKTVNLIGHKPPLRSNHSGLANVAKRLKFAYQEAASFTYGTHEGHFCTEVKVPIARLL